jgi:hypothetical protein
MNILLHCSGVGQQGLCYLPDEKLNVNPLVG